MSSTKQLRTRPVAEDPKLVWNYTGIAIATFIAGNIIHLCFYKRDGIEEAENALGKEHDEGNGTLGTAVKSV
jgi:hypothetical protein